MEKNPTKKGEDESKTKTKKPKSSAEANSGQLDVAIYNPRNHEGENRSDGRGLIRDVVGNPTGFTRNRTGGVKPEFPRHFRERIEVAYIDDVLAFEEVMDSVPVQNDVAHWSCQDYIMEALGKLHEEDVIDEYNHDEAFNKLEGMFHRGTSTSSSEV